MLPQHQKISILIVDDEDLAREKIRHFCGEDHDCVIIGECSNGFQAVEALCHHVPDVVFLDIQMPELDGFETLRLIQDSLEDEATAPFVVFITAFDEYALKAFEAHAIDYLLKPYDFERFHAMLFRVKNYVRNRQTLNSHEHLLREISTLQQLQSIAYSERFAFKTRGRIYFVESEHVNWIEADRNYALFHVGENTHVLRSTFHELEKRLNPAQFLRIHRSFIVRKDFVGSLTKRTDGSERLFEVVLKNGKILDIGEGYRDSVFAALGVHGDWQNQ